MDERQSQGEMSRDRLKGPILRAIVMLPAILVCTLLARSLPDAVILQFLLATGLTVAAVGIAEILERRHAPPSHEPERALREEKELFDLFMRHSPIYTFIKEVTATESRTLQASDNFSEMIGLGGRNLIGKTMQELFPPEFAERISADDWEVVTSGRVLRLDEDLNGRNYTTIKFPIIQGGKTLLAGYTIDITDRKQAEEALRQSEAKLREANARLQETYQRFLTVLNGIDAFIHVTDTRNHVILFGNHTAKRLFGEDIEGRKCHQALRQENLPCRFCKIPSLLSDPARSEQVVTWESFNPLTGRWFLNSERIVDWPEAPAALLTVGTDITGVKKAEEEKQLLAEKLHHAQKMEAIGVLASSIAHDLNNILTGIVSYPDLLLAGLAADDPMRGPLEIIRGAGGRAAKIVQGLLTLSRRGMQVEEPVDLRLLVDDYLQGPECLELLRRHQRVRIVPPAERTSLVVSGSPVHLANVLMNLMINAAEAMPEGGVITISLERVDLQEPLPGFAGWRQGPYACLSVADTGVGIAKGDRERIFEPFFSLKPQGVSGTGLGLAVVWGTVADHRGHIEVESEESRGTRFSVYLPLAGEGGSMTVAPAEVAMATGQGEAVLVVDDDGSQRKIAGEILTHLGYRVSVAASGEEAVRHLQAQEADLVILDMLMPPGIDGLETYRLIRETRPDQRAIIVSGFSHSERVGEALSLGVSHYLQKPYSMEKLSRTVRAALTGDAQAVHQRDAAQND
jgi:PAS domain S-box-containing protein